MRRLRTHMRVARVPSHVYLYCMSVQSTGLCVHARMWSTRVLCWSHACLLACCLFHSRYLHITTKATCEWYSLDTRGVFFNLWAVLYCRWYQIRYATSKHIEPSEIELLFNSKSFALHVQWTINRAFKCDNTGECYALKAEISVIIMHVQQQILL